MTQGETLTVTGSHAANVKVGGNLAAGSDTGNLTVTAVGSAPHSITTGSGNDSITAGHGGDTINAGGGGDTINVAGHSVADTFQFKSATDSLNVAGKYDTIAGWSDTGANDKGTFNDVLDFSAITGLTTIQGGLNNANQTVAAHSIAWIYNASTNQTMVFANATSAALSQTSATLMAVDLTGGNFHLSSLPPTQHNLNIIA
jgi:hypothetical protein